MWQLTALALFGLLLASRKPSLPIHFFWAHYKQERKKNKNALAQTHCLHPHQKNHRPASAYPQRRKKLESVSRGLSTLLIQINSVNRRESPWSSRECLVVMLSEQINQICPRNRPLERLLTQECGKFFEAVIYIQTQVFPFIVNM